MTRRLFASLICLFWLQAAIAAKPPSNDSFSGALLGTSIGDNPVQAYFLVNILRDAGAPASDVEALELELLHRYREQAGGLATVRSPITVATAIAAGKSRSPVTDSEFVSAWQTAFAKGLGIRWSAVDGPAPYFTFAARYLKPVAAGLWAAESSSGKTYFTLALRLVNNASLPLPIHRPDMVWGGEAGTGRGGLAFACDWDEVPPPPGNVKADEVFLLEPGAETRPLFCEATPVGAYWKERLPALVAAAQSGGDQPQIFSHAFDDLNRLRHLEGALTATASRAGDWRSRYQASQQQVGLRWKTAAQPLEAPVAKKWAWVPHEGWPAAGQKLQWFLGATLLSLALFGAGRALSRAGVPQRVVSLGTLVVLGALFAFAMHRLGLTSGSGYDSPLYTGLALWAAVIGPMGFGVAILYWLHRLLDAENLTWWQTVARGWLRAADLHSPTSRAEFWGFFAQLVWWWGLFNVCLKPLHLWLGGILLYPLLTLVVRRSRSMRGAEILSVAVTVVCLVLLAIA